MTTKQIDAVFDRHPAQHEAMPEAEADLTEVIYRDPDGGFALQPPPGKLDGWEARRVGCDLWDDYDDACRDAADTERKARLAIERRNALREKLVEAWNRA